MTETISLEIAVLGEIWWPTGLPCSMTKTIRLGDGPFEVDIDPVQDDIASWIDTHFGDFSMIIDWQCIKINKTVQIEGNQVVTRESYETIKDWKDADTECMYFDTFPE